MLKEDEPPVILLIKFALSKMSVVSPLGMAF